VAFPGPPSTVACAATAGPAGGTEVVPADSGGKVTALADSWESFQSAFAALSAGGTGGGNLESKAGIVVLIISVEQFFPHIARKKTTPAK
jgi:hypothetical protein